jgi:hypothetical protein
MGDVAIFGASSEVGMELGQVFAKAGFNLMLVSRRCERLLPLKKDIELRYKVRVSLIELDVLEISAVDQFFREYEEGFPVVSCICFGYLGNESEARTNFDEFQRILQVNYFCAAYISNCVGRIYHGRGGGCLIGFSSVAGDRGRGSNYMYGSAKAGFSTFLSGLRNHLSGRNVHVMTVKPGFIDTKMTAHLTLPKTLTLSAQEVAMRVFKAYKRKNDVVYIGWYWRYIMFVIRSIPERIFKKLSL